MRDLAWISARLDAAPAAAIRGTLTRLVPFVPVTKNRPVDWLFTTGRPNRYNPAGTECVYFAEDEATARAEYDQYWAGLPGAAQPLVTYFAEVQLRRVLDLTSKDSLKALGVRPSELFTNWRRAKRPTVTQLIGQAVNTTCKFSAIRYPSNATRDAGFPGTNIVIFRTRIQRPDFVHILGPTKKPLQKWP